jgi:hypothetical protein
LLRQVLGIAAITAYLDPEPGTSGTDNGTGGTDDGTSGTDDGTGGTDDGTGNDSIGNDSTGSGTGAPNVRLAQRLAQIVGQLF